MRFRLLLLAATLLGPIGALAQEAGKLVAIQPRSYRLGHEIEVGGLFEPLDAFSKGLAVEGAYTLHLDDSWGWEILRGAYLTRLDTGLSNDLLSKFGLNSTKSEQLQWYASSNFVYAPLFGKLALGNSSVVHGEVFLSGGAALGHFNTFYAPGPELGVGFRVFLNRTFSLRFDARDAFFIGKNERHNLLLLSLGLSINLGGPEPEAPSFASSPPGGPRPVAVQQRALRLGHELEIAGMLEPLDPYSKGLFALGGYTVHFDDAWGWEVVRGGYASRLDTNVLKQLVDLYAVDPRVFEVLQWYLSSNLVWAPLYGKFALRNAAVAHAEAFVTFGGALGHFSNTGGRITLPVLNGVAPAPEVGVGVRFFLNQSFSIRFDARDAYFFGKTAQHNLLFLSLGLAINLGGAD